MKTPDVKALLFDVFGTVVDWRSSLIADFSTWGKVRGIEANWTSLVDAWRGAYVPSMNEVRKQGARGWRNLDELHRSSLQQLIVDFGIVGLNSDDIDYLVHGWHRLNGWPDSVAGLTKLKQKFIIGTLSNGNVALLVNMAKHAGLPWDIVMSAELFRHYKPDPQVYLGAADLLALPPEQVMLVAAHNRDLAAARALGLATGFVARPNEYGPQQKRDKKPEQDWDIIASDFGDLAGKLGC